MSVPILSCPCGLRMKAKGATPGRVGRCPKCGQTLTVPEVAVPEVEPEAEAEPQPEAGSIPRGYVLPPTFRPSVSGPREGAKRRRVAPAKAADVSRAVEPWWRPDLLFPTRGAEGLIIVAMLGLMTWGVATLLPELCLQLVADAGTMGATLMGILVSLVASLPGLAIGLFLVTYALQYLGRVLVSGAMGEVAPPRPPDRNFDGLLNGLSPWLVWLACGATVGLGPLAAYLVSRSWDAPASPLVILIFAVVGVPYVLMALLMTFLDEGGFPNPSRVVGTLIRFHFGFLAICAVEVVLGLVVLGGFALMLWLRSKEFWPYFVLMLPCWMLAHWASIVAMRVLGVFYHQHASTLRWHRKKPWWDVTLGN